MLIHIIFILVSIMSGSENLVSTFICIFLVTISKQEHSRSFHMILVVDD